MSAAADIPGSVILAEWIARQHQGQLIRRTSEPYFNHLLRVAEIARNYTRFGYEIGLCHDLLEKTAVTANQLCETLLDAGYTLDESDHISSAVIELTDFYTKARYPHLSKTGRKEKEAVRLITIDPAAQTVKYADLYENIDWMLKYDQGNAIPYLQRKGKLVNAMTSGDPELREKVLRIIDAALRLR